MPASRAQMKGGHEVSFWRLPSLCVSERNLSARTIEFLAYLPNRYR
jgi:hypothetical protein